MWGWFLIEQALRHGTGDLDRSGAVSVEEAWTWARPQAIDTTQRQRYGAQDAVIVDDLDGELHLGVPGVRPAPRPAPQTEQPAGERTPRPPPPSQPAPEREPDRHGSYLCVLCGGR